MEASKAKYIILLGKIIKYIINYKMIYFKKNSYSFSMTKND